MENTEEQPKEQPKKKRGRVRTNSERSMSIRLPERYWFLMDSLEDSRKWSGVQLIKASLEEFAMRNEPHIYGDFLKKKEGKNIVGE